jgi:hypothetical protein
MNNLKNGDLMKFLLLTLALSLTSIQLHAEDSAENTFTLKVRSAINKRLSLSNTEDFEIVKQGRTTFGKYCEVKIEQNIENSNGLYYANIDIPGRMADDSFQFHDGLLDAKKETNLSRESMEIVSNDASKLLLKLTQRKCSGGYLTAFCDNTVRTLEISAARNGKIKVETMGTIKGLKGLWTSDRSTCIIDAE